MSHCWMFSLSGVPGGDRCEIYPCSHVETYDLDFLSDREDQWTNPNLHMLMWTCYRNPEVLQACKVGMCPTRFAKLESGYQRCLRLETKQEAINADFEAHEQRMTAERLAYFAYWESFTAEQLAVFRKDEVFKKRHESYSITKAVWEEE
jgi:hypothetical protein